MARKRVSQNNDGALVDVDPDTGVMLTVNGAPPPGGEPPNNPADFADPDDNAATRRTADLYWQLLGENDSGVGYVTVNFLGNGQGAPETSVDRYPGDKYTLDEMIEEIRKRHAHRLHPGREGDYRIRLYAKSRRGNFAVVGNRLVTIMAPDLPDRLPAPVGDVPPLLAELVRSMRADTEKLRDELRAIAQVREKPGTNFLDVVTVLAPIVTPLIVAAMNRPKDDPMKALTAALALTGTIRDMRQENDAPPVSSEESAPWWAPPLMQVVQNLPVMLAQVNAQRAQIPAPPIGGTPTPAAPVAPAVSNAGQPGHPFYRQVDGLVKVQNQSDPDEVATLLLAQVPPEHKAALLAFLGADDAFATLAHIHPGVLHAPGWWADLFDALHEQSAPVNTAADETTGGGVHDGAGSDHGATNS